MYELDILFILLLAMGLGVIHALDADHIAMVTGLSSSHAGFKKSMIYCTRWALGHSLTLMVIGALVFLIGISIPAYFSHAAELLVGFFLIVIGVMLLVTLRKQHVHLHYHQHDGSHSHAHWHSHESDTSHKHQHRTLLIGSLHGLAGSAPLLALIPLAVDNRPALGFAYLLTFSIGVIIAMLLFGGLLNIVAKQLIRLSARLFVILRLVIGFVSIGVGLMVVMRVAA